MSYIRISHFDKRNTVLTKQANTELNDCTLKIVMKINKPAQRSFRARHRDIFAAARFAATMRRRLGLQDMQIKGFSWSRLPAYLST